MTRLRNLLTLLAKSSLTFVLVIVSEVTLANEIVDVGTRRELFVDRHLIEKLDGKAEQRLHHPQPREIAMVHDAPWEGSGSGYHSIFRDGDRYRMYYKAWQLDVENGKVVTNRHPLFCCYAESDDGIHWRKPNLGLHEFNGSKANNIVIPHGPMGPVNPDVGIRPCSSMRIRMRRWMQNTRPSFARTLPKVYSR